MIHPVRLALLPIILFLLVFLLIGCAKDRYQQRADLIKVAVIDTELPDEDTEKLLDQLHELSPELKLVLMLGAANPGRPALSNRPEISGRLAKPVTLESLSQALANALSSEPD